MRFSYDNLIDSKNQINTPKDYNFCSKEEFKQLQQSNENQNTLDAIQTLIDQIKKPTTQQLKFIQKAVNVMEKFFTSRIQADINRRKKQLIKVHKCRFINKEQVFDLPEEVDVLVLFTTIDDPKQGFTAANVWSRYNKDNGFDMIPPKVSDIIINLAYLSKGSFSSFVKTLIHEQLHFFGFNTDNFKYNQFPDPSPIITHDGYYLVGKNLAQLFFFIQKPLLDTASLYFQNEVKYFPAEIMNIGFKRQIGSHFSFMLTDDIMGPMTQLLLRVTPITFSFLEANNWFKYSQDEQDFDVPTYGGSQRYFPGEQCTIDQKNRCNEDRTGYGMCRTWPEQGVQRVNTQFLCGPNTLDVSLGFMQNLSTRSVCLDMQKSAPLIGIYKSKPACYDIQCHEDNKTFDILLTSKKNGQLLQAAYPCFDETGKKVSSISASQDIRTYTIFCPNYEEVCENRYQFCQENCNEGVCIGGKCICAGNNQSINCKD